MAILSRAQSKSALWVPIRYILLDHPQLTTSQVAVFENLIAILKAANSDLSRVVKTTVFLDDMANFNSMNSVYGKYFPTHKPARSCVAAKQLPKGVPVEIECIALEN